MPQKSILSLKTGQELAFPVQSFTSFTREILDIVLIVQGMVEKCRKKMDQKKKDALLLIHEIVVSLSPFMICYSS